MSEKRPWMSALVRGVIFALSALERNGERRCLRLARAPTSARSKRSTSATPTGALGRTRPATQLRPFVREQVNAETISDKNGHSQMLPGVFRQVTAN